MMHFFVDVVVRPTHSLQFRKIHLTSATLRLSIPTIQMNGCNGGGSVETAYEWLEAKPHHGMVYESDYPYTSSEDAETDDSTAACTHTHVDPVVSVHGCAVVWLLCDML